MTKPPAYIGMTGLSSRQEADEVLAGHEEKNLLLMIGVLASYKSLNGLELDQPKRYPPKEILADIFPEAAKVLNILHINAPPEAFLDTMLQGKELAQRCQGIQLNITWPVPAILEKYLKIYPDDILILQCGRRALEQTGDVKGLAARVKQYEGLARYVLIDTSGGRGIPFDVEHAKRCFEALQPLSLGLGIAGGLDSSKLHKLHRLKSFMPFSIDAESGLRTDDDLFSARKALHYLKCAATVYKERLLERAEG